MPNNNENNEEEVIRITSSAVPVDDPSVKTENVAQEATQEEILKETLRQTAEAMQDSLDSFSDQMESCCGDSSAQQGSEETLEDEEPDVEEAVNLFQRFQDYISSKLFHDRVNTTAQKYGIPPKRVAEGFFGKVLGTVGDAVGIALGTVGNLAHSVVEMFTAVLHGGINLIVSAASALARLLTFNKTCIVEED